MKKFILSVLVLISAFSFSGCQSAISTLDKNLTGVSASEVTYVRKGKFTSATIKGDNYINSTDKVTADSIYIDEEIIGVGSINITLKGYQRLKQKEETTPAVK